MKIYLIGDDHSFSFEMENECVTIGRSKENDFHVPHEELSRNHCELYLEDEIISILDLGSKNGVYVDGIRIPPNEKYPINLQTQVLISKSLILSFFNRPGSTTTKSRAEKISIEATPYQKPDIIRRKK